MSRLSELMEELCPDGVKYMLLGKVAEIRSGWGFSKWEQGLKEGDLPFFKVADMNHPKNADYMTVADNYVSYETSQKLRCNPAPRDTVIFPKTGMAIATNKTRMLSCEACYDNHIMGVIAGEQVLARFLYYILEATDKMKIAKGKGAVPFINLPAVKALRIPVPPLPVQAEIVRILDKFSSRTTELIASLSREHQLRIKQYEYYRDKLLTFEPDSSIGVKFVKLGDIATITRGGNFQKRHFVPEGSPCIHYGQIHTHYGVHTDKAISCVSPEIFSKSKKAQPGDIVMATTSEDVKGVCKCTAWLGTEPAAVSGDAVIIHHNQNPKYLAYFFQSEIFQSQKRPLAYGVKVTRVAPQKLAEVLVPIPPLSVQTEIVRILDKFSSHTNGLIPLLEAELADRKKQYAYYRDKLLTFTEKQD